MLLWFTLQYHQLNKCSAKTKSSGRVQIKTNGNTTYQCFSMATLSKFPSKDCLQNNNSWFILKDLKSDYVLLIVIKLD